MTNFKRNLIVISMLLFGIAGAAFAQSLDNKGNDFYMAFMPNFDSNVNIQVHLTSETTTDVTVQYPANSPTFNQTVTVNPGAITIVSLPITPSAGWTPGVVQDNLVRAFGADEFVAYMINIRPFSSDAALALPVDTYNTEFLVMSYFSTTVSTDRSEFAVVSAFDNTNVTITPKAPLAGGFPANVPFTITLNQGEGFLAQGTTFGSAGDLTGSLVESDKPISMTNGNICTNVPPNQTFCDHIFEVAQPTQTWGNRSLVQNLTNNPQGAVYRVLASQDNTSLELDGSVVATLNKGEFFETNRLPGSHEFLADKPIFVTQFMTGVNPGSGDPAMGNQIPPDQYQNAYTFSTVGGNQFIQHFVNIIAENGDVGSILLDGSPLAGGLFSPIGSSGYSAATVQISDGTHSTSSPNGHGITVYGVNNDDSYIYPGGALFNFINPVGDANPPICDININGDQANGSAIDNRPSEDTNGNGDLDSSEDLNNNGQIDEDTGIFFLVLDAGSNNVTLNVDPFVPGDGVVNYSVSVIDNSLPASGVIRATDGAGNTCTSDFSYTPAPQNTDPLCSIAPSDNYTVNEGDPISFSVTGNDTDPNAMVTISVSGLPSGATMTPSLPVTGPDGVSSSFDWTPADGQDGTYEVVYTLTDENSAQTTCSVNITVLDANPQTDTTDPLCEIIGVDPGPPVVLSVMLQDTESGISHVNVLRDKNADVVVPSFTPGTNEALVVTATKIDPSKGSNVVLEVFDMEGNSTICDPVYTTLSTIAPEDFQLEQNYPNPFNPTTTIRFGLANAQTFVSLKVYDISGREVRTLINENISAGQYSVEWDGKDNSGREVAGGIYLYRLTAGNFVQTRKMTFLK